MDAPSLLNNLTRRGFRMTLSEDRERIVVEPGTKLTDEDCELIKSLKPELLQLLRSAIPATDDRVLCGRCELKNHADAVRCYHCLALLAPEIVAKVKAIAPLARSLGWHLDRLWDADGLASQLAAEDEIGAVEADYIEILKTTHDLQRFYRKH